MEDEPCCAVTVGIISPAPTAVLPKPSECVMCTGANRGRIIRLLLLLLPRQCGLALVEARGRTTEVATKVYTGRGSARALRYVILVFMAQLKEETEETQAKGLG